LRHDAALGKSVVGLNGWLLEMPPDLGETLCALRVEVARGARDIECVDPLCCLLEGDLFCLCGEFCR
jgi:hypothetical protein